MGNIAGLRHEAKSARGVQDTYLKELAKLGTKIQELSFINMKQSSAFVQLGSSCICLLMGPRSVVLVMALLYTSLWMFISFPAKCQWQQILQEYLKNFERIFFICCTHPYFKEKNQVHRCNEHGSQNACQHFISFSFWGREASSFLFFTKGFFYLYSSFTNFFSFQQNSNKTKIKLHEQSTGAFGRVHKVHF